MIYHAKYLLRTYFIQTGSTCNPNFANNSDQH